MRHSGRFPHRRLLSARPPALLADGGTARLPPPAPGRVAGAASAGRPRRCGDDGLGPAAGAGLSLAGLSPGQRAPRLSRGALARPPRLARPARPLPRLPGILPAQPAHGAAAGPGEPGGIDPAALDPAAGRRRISPARPALVRPDEAVARAARPARGH